MPLGSNFPAFCSYLLTLPPPLANLGATIWELVASSLLSLPLPVWNLCPSELGQGRKGP